MSDLAAGTYPVSHAVNRIVDGEYDQGLAEFTVYFVRNYPGPETIIGDPNWHAPKIYRAATHILRAKLARVELDRDATRSLLCLFIGQVDDAWEGEVVDTDAMKRLAEKARAFLFPREEAL